MCCIIPIQWFMGIYYTCSRYILNTFELEHNGAYKGDSSQVVSPTFSISEKLTAAVIYCCNCSVCADNDTSSVGDEYTNMEVACSSVRINAPHEYYNCCEMEVDVGTYGGYCRHGWIAEMWELQICRNYRLVSVADM